MKERLRVAAVIVENQRLLLVKGPAKYKEYWTPGGKVEEGESELNTLNRELKEELGVKVISAKFFGEYSAKSPYEVDTITKTHVYIVSFSGKIKVGNEIQDFVWMSKKDFEDNKYPLIAIDRENIIPEVIKENYF